MVTRHVRLCWNLAYVDSLWEENTVRWLKTLSLVVQLVGIDKFCIFVQTFQLLYTHKFHPFSVFKILLEISFRITCSTIYVLHFRNITWSTIYSTIKVTHAITWLIYQFNFMQLSLYSSHSIWVPYPNLNLMVSLAISS
jgi:hypothetical protein